MGVMVDSSLWLVQDLYYQPYVTPVLGGPGDLVSPSKVGL